MSNCVSEYVSSTGNDLFYIHKKAKTTKRLLLWRSTVNKWITLARVVHSHTCQEFSFIPKTIKGLVKICLYSELTQKIFTDDQITRLEVSLQDNELWHYCVHPPTPPLPVRIRSPVQALDWCNGGRLWLLLLCTPPFFPPTEFLKRKGSVCVFFFTHHRQFLLYISCVRRSVVWRESESQWNTVAYSIILVVMETIELTKSVKWLQGLSATKFIIRRNASVQNRAPYT